MRLDGLETECAIRPHARQDDANGAIPLVPRQGTEQHVDGQAHPARLLRLGEAQYSVDHREFGVGRDHVHAIGLHPHGCGDFPYRQGGRTLQEFGEHRLVRWVEMLYDDIGEPARHGHVGQELLEGFKAARGGAQPDNARRQVVAIREDTLWSRQVHRSFRCHYPSKWMARRRNFIPSQVFCIILPAEAVPVQQTVSRVESATRTGMGCWCLL